MKLSSLEVKNLYLIDFKLISEEITSFILTIDNDTKEKLKEIIVDLLRDKSQTINKQNLPIFDFWLKQDKFLMIEYEDSWEKNISEEISNKVFKLIRKITPDKSKKISNKEDILSIYNKTIRAWCIEWVLNNNRFLIFEYFYKQKMLLNYSLKNKFLTFLVGTNNTITYTDKAILSFYIEDVSIFYIKKNDKGKIYVFNGEKFRKIFNQYDLLKEKAKVYIEKSDYILFN